MVEKIDFVFNVFIALGLVVPILDVALGFFGSILNIDFEIGGHQVGDLFEISGDADTGSMLPFNIMCLCFALVVFGAVGKLTLALMVNTLAILGILVGLIAISFGAYYLVFRFIVKPLKYNNPKAIGHWDLFMTKGKLTLRITTDSPGTVSLRDSTGAMISYCATAKEDVLKAWDGIIPQGVVVTVVDLDTNKKIAYVKPLDTLENHKLK